MSQETERYQLENNGNSYLVRTTAGGGGADVEANPEGTATTDLTKLKVDDTIYGIPEGTEVVANPTLAGTESALTGLQVGDTKYAIPSGDVSLHTYTVKTYTPSDTDYLQLLDDLDKRRDIQIQNRIASLVRHEYENTWIYSSAGNSYDTYTSQINCYTFTKSGDNITISANVIPITAVDMNNAAGTLARGLRIGPNIINFAASQTAFSTTAPTANNTSGYLQIVVLSSEPATRYNGYLYIITA